MAYRLTKNRERNVGCEIGTDCVRLFELRGARGEHVQGAEAAVSAPTSWDEAATDEWLGRAAAIVAQLHAERSFEGRRLVVSAPPPLVSYRRLVIAGKVEKEIERALCSELAREANVERSDLCCDFYESEPESEVPQQRREVVAVCSPARPLDCLATHLHAHNFDLSAVDTPLGAIARALSNAPAIGVPEQPVLVLSVGACEIKAFVAVQGAPTFVHSFGPGRLSFDGDTRDRSRVAEEVGDIIREVGICLHFLEERCDLSRIPNRACILGAGSATHDLAESLCDRLGLGVSNASDLLSPRLRAAVRQLPKSCVLDNWLVPLGLAIYGMPRGHQEKQ